MNALRRPVLLVLAALSVGAVGTALLAITDVKNGGFTVYHPFDLLGLAIDTVAVVILAIGIWQVARGNVGQR
jgi:hypothetical protein